MEIMDPYRLIATALLKIKTKNEVNREQRNFAKEFYLALWRYDVWDGYQGIKEHFAKSTDPFIIKLDMENNAGTYVERFEEAFPDFRASNETIMKNAYKGLLQTTILSSDYAEKKKQLTT